MPAPPYEIACSGNPHSGDAAASGVTVFVACSGAKTPRPVTMRRDDQGIWKAEEWSSLIVGIWNPA